MTETSEKGILPYQEEVDGSQDLIRDKLDVLLKELEKDGTKKSKVWASEVAEISELIKPQATSMNLPNNKVVAILASQSEVIKNMCEKVASVHSYCVAFDGKLDKVLSGQDTLTGIMSNLVEANKLIGLGACATNVMDGKDLEANLTPFIQ